jgi:outer membrane protein assembly factor BamB
MGIEQLIFVGLNGRVMAMDRDTGRLAWEWQSPKPKRGFVTVMLDGDRLVVGLGGYLYCLDAGTGRVFWQNPLTGYGLGMFSFASVRGHSLGSEAAAQAQADEESASASASAPVT